MDTNDYLRLNNFSRSNLGIIKLEPRAPEIQFSGIPIHETEAKRKTYKFRMADLRMNSQVFLKKPKQFF